MNLEKNYYAQSKETLKEIENAIKSYESSLTETERAEVDKRRKRDLQNIISEYHTKSQQVSPPAPDPEKVEFFEDLAQQALKLAKHIQADITVNTSESMRGNITLTTDCILIESNFPQVARITLCNLITSASDIYMAADKDTMEFNFSFDLRTP